MSSSYRVDVLPLFKKGRLVPKSLTAGAPVLGKPKLTSAPRVTVKFSCASIAIIPTISKVLLGAH